MNFNQQVQSLVIIVSVIALMALIPPGKRVASIKIRSAIFKENQFAKRSKKINNTFYITIDKSDYELKVYDSAGWYATYPVVFGSSGLADKMESGDKKTPEGHFTVILKKIHPKWSYELLLDYPNKESIAIFKERKRKGLLSKNAAIGNGIAIHATRPDEEWTVDNFYNWTDGCISAKYSEMKDLYSYIPVGTPVTIKQ